MTGDAAQRRRIETALELWCQYDRWCYDRRKQTPEAVTRRIAVLRDRLARLDG